MKRCPWLCVVLLSAWALTSAGAWAEEAKKPTTDEDYELYQVFADTLDQVQRNYVKDVSRRELMEAAIQGVLGKLDPYSNYISPEDISRFRSSVEAQFGGIGIQIGPLGEQLQIISPLYGTPAYRAGLESGDIILEIDGKSTEGVRIDDAVKLLKGEPGTKVALTVRHVGSPDKQTVTLTRELVHVETVLGDRRKSDDTWDFMLDPDKKIGYIRITAFSRDTAQDVKKALADLEQRGMKGLILDLRFNPGGLLNSAIEVSDLFVTDGRIVSTKGRNTQERTWDAQKDGTFGNFKMAILVNHYSASASEIVSACLQDNHRAVVIGERTWGKGSVQNVIELEGGRSALKLTTASYHRPNGKNIHRFPDSKDTDEWGVSPDGGYEVKLNGFQTERLIINRRERDILRGKHAKALAAATTAEPSKEAPKADEPKTEPAKSEDPTTDEAKPAADKPEEPKSSPTDESGKEEPKKDESGKADEAKPAQPAKDAAPAGDAPAAADAKPNATPDAGAKSEAKAAFVDLQLQKALDYLTQEIARAQ
jgi:carboxyl-terminal processing protease